MKDLYEMPGVVVNLKTEEEFNEYMSMCEKVGWKWIDYNRLDPLNYFDFMGSLFSSKKTKFCVTITSRFFCASTTYFNEMPFKDKFKIITFQELKDILSDWEIGDILMDTLDNKIKILGKMEILGEMRYATSEVNDFGKYDHDGLCTREQLEGYGCKLEPKKITVSKKEISDKFNIPLELLEIGE